MSNADLIARLDHMSKLLGVGSYDVPAILREARDALAARDKVIVALREALWEIVSGDDELLAELEKLGIPRSPENIRLTEMARAALALADGTERT